jgi:uncharacterized membrane protein YedE/YeeE
MEWLTMRQWSPYVVGVAIGLLDCAVFVFLDKALGCSTAFARTSGMIERAFRGPKVAEKAYYRKFAPVIDWEWMLVLGVVLGALISASISGDFKLVWLPSRWVSAFGDSAGLRVIVAAIGGVLMGFGARWAGGCTSGHGISGSLQLSLSSWIAVICFFIGGVATAMLLFKVFAS